MAAPGTANDNVKSAQLPQRLIWLPFCLPLSNARCHAATSPNLRAHTCARAQYPRTRTRARVDAQTPRDVGCIMKKTCKDTSICSRSPLLSPLLADKHSHIHTYVHTHTYKYTDKHTHTHRGNPSPSFRPPQQPWHAVERGRRPHLENRRGLLLCFDGELTPKFCQNSTSPFFFSLPYHSALLRGFL